MATKCDEEFDLIKFFKGKAKVWLYFNVKQHKVSKRVIDNVAVCLKCGVEVKCPGGTTISQVTCVAITPSCLLNLNMVPKLLMKHPKFKTLMVLSFFCLLQFSYTNKCFKLTKFDIFVVTHLKSTENKRRIRKNAMS